MNYLALSICDYFALEKFKFSNSGFTMKISSNQELYQACQQGMLHAICHNVSVRADRHSLFSVEQTLFYSALCLVQRCENDIIVCPPRQLSPC